MTPDTRYWKLSVASTGMHTSALGYSHSLTHSTGTAPYRLTATASSSPFQWSDVNLCSRLGHLSVSDGVFISAFLVFEWFRVFKSSILLPFTMSGRQWRFSRWLLLPGSTRLFVYLWVLFPLFISHMGCCGKLPWSNVFPGKLPERVMWRYPSGGCFPVKKAHYYSRRA